MVWFKRRKMAGGNVMGYGCGNAAGLEQGTLIVVGVDGNTRHPLRRDFLAVRFGYSIIDISSNAVGNLLILEHRLILIVVVILQMGITNVMK